MDSGNFMPGFLDAHAACKEEIEPGILIPIPDNEFSVLIFTDFAEPQKAGKAADLKVTQGWNLHEFLDVFDIIFEIPAFDHGGFLPVNFHGSKGLQKITFKNPPVQTDVSGQRGTFQGKKARKGKK
jgi:hypothetical protein